MDISMSENLIQSKIGIETNIFDCDYSISKNILKFHIEKLNGILIYQKF
jgi:hypothetical protein